MRSGEAMPRCDAAQSSGVQGLPLARRASRDLCGSDREPRRQRVFAGRKSELPPRASAYPRQTKRGYRPQGFLIVLGINADRLEVAMP